MPPSAPFTLVAWNCRSAFERKAPQLLTLTPDICVVCEVRQSVASALGFGFETFWNGAPNQRGLLVAAKRPWRIEEVEMAAEDFATLATLRGAGQRLFLLAVWSKPLRSDYVGPLSRNLRQLLTRIPQGARAIVAGDFNASPYFDAGNPKAQAFETVLAPLREQGQASLYHEQSGEAFGVEKTPTYFQHGRLSEPYHIDYVFASEAQRRAGYDIDIGGHCDWSALSDHTPLTARFSE